ncbi:MAG: hypothetical protein V3U65_19090 [Granulosicoccaceae bacterium]
MKRKKALAAKKVSVRNRVAQNPLIQKGGVHQQSNKAKRQAQKMAMKKRKFERGAVTTAIGSSFFWLYREFRAAV